MPKWPSTDSRVLVTDNTMTLTWRNVAAPNFSGANQASAMANDLILRALSGAQNTLQRADQRDRARVNNAAMAQLAGLSNPETAAQDARAILNSVNPNRLDADTLRFAAGRPDSLLERQLTGNQVRDSNAAFEAATRIRDQKKLFDERAPVLAALRNAVSTGNAEEAQRIRAENPDLLEGLSGQDILNYNQGNRDARGQELNLARGEFGFDKEVEAALDRDAVNGVMAELSTSLDTRQANIRLNEMRQNGQINDRVYNTVRNQISSLGLVDGNSPFLSVSSVGGAGSDPLRIVNYEARSRGFREVPENVRTLGELENWGTRVLENSDGTYSSASGPYQITRNTFREFAPQVLGENWRSAENSIEAHDAVARAIFENSRGSNAAIRGRWAALKKYSDARVEEIRNMPWEQARDAIAADESGTIPSQILSQRAASALQTQSAVGVNQALSQATANSPVYDGYYGNIGDRRPTAQVVTQAIQDPESFFYEADRELVDQRIQSVKDMASKIRLPNGERFSLNTAQALAIMAENGQATGGIESFLTDWARNDDLGNGRDIDWDRIEADLQSIANGDGEGYAQTLNSINSTQAQIGQAQQVLEAAQARYQQGLNRGLTPEQLAPLALDLERAQAMFVQANRGVQQSRDSLNLSANNRPQGRRQPQPQSQWSFGLTSPEDIARAYNPTR